MNMFILGFTIGIITIYLIYHILFRIFWYCFKLKGKRHNLKVIKCKLCRNYFYSFDFETNSNCCNCILLNIDKK